MAIMDSLGNYLLQRCKTLRVSRSELALRAGISRETLYRLMRGDINRASIDTVYHLARALQVAPIQLMRLIYHDFDMGPGTSLKTHHPGDHQSFVDDVTIPDNMVVSANQRFTKIWEVQNTGKLVWEGRSYRCVDDDLVLAKRMEDGTLVPIMDTNLAPLVREAPCPTVRPGETVKISVEFRAPKYPCSTLSLWKMYDAAGNACFPEHTGLWCKVRVVTL
jgi:transcriptional regulator with XRE-family HTH domain